MLKLGSLKDKLEVKVLRDSLKEPTVVTVSIVRNMKEDLPYRGGFKDIRTGRYLLLKNAHLTL
jgi:hypothetical protein